MEEITMQEHVEDACSVIEKLLSFANGNINLESYLVIVFHNVCIRAGLYLEEIGVAPREPVSFETIRQTMIESLKGEIAHIEGRDKVQH